jgi:hypothetical protein
VALITLPPPREVARPEMPRDSVLSTGRVDEEEWVTVFGYVWSLLLLIRLGKCTRFVLEF